MYPHGVLEALNREKKKEEEERQREGGVGERERERCKVARQNSYPHCCFPPS